MKKSKEIPWNKPALAAKRPGKEPDETEKTISMDFCTLKMPLSSINWDVNCTLYRNLSPYFDGPPSPYTSSYS